MDPCFNRSTSQDAFYDAIRATMCIRVSHFQLALSHPPLRELAMSTPSLQDVLCVIPTFAAQVEAMTELSPGVASSPANVTALLKFLTDAGEYQTTYGAVVRPLGVRFKTRKAKGGSIDVKVCMSPVALHDGVQQLGSASFPCTEDGLMKGIAFAKDITRRVREDGICPCSTGYLTDCYMKLPGMSLCGRCQMSAAIGS